MPAFAGVWPETANTSTPAAARTSAAIWGNYYITNQHHVVAHGFDSLEGLAKQHGVLREWEEIEELARAATHEEIEEEMDLCE